MNNKTTTYDIHFIHNHYVPRYQAFRIPNLVSAFVCNMLCIAHFGLISTSLILRLMTIKESATRVIRLASSLDALHSDRLLPEQRKRRLCVFFTIRCTIRAMTVYDMII